MEEYEVLQDSPEYEQFLKEHQDYAKIFGYDMTVPVQVKTAMYDGFLFDQFLEEVV